MIDKICGYLAALILPERTESSHPAAIGEITAPPMKTMPLRGFALLPLLLASSAFGQALPYLFESEGAGPPNKLYWQTEPGVRYDLWKSDNLSSWQRVTGYPAVAEGLAMEHAFTPEPGGKGFFKMIPIDDQPPVIEDQFPGVDAYAVRRFDDLRFLISDSTGIDPASIRLTVGNGSTMSIGAQGLVYANNILTYDSGDTALGAYGATVPVTLIVADTLGHSVTHTFSFTLEVEPKVVANLYVFGSPTAQRAGQRIPATPTAALAKAAGPVAMTGADPWEISSVLPDRVVIAYTGVTAPIFALDTYLANLTPVNLSDIFYRKILSVSDDTALKQLTLMTTDVPFAEIVEEGTASISADSVVYDLGEDGTIQPALERSYTFPRVGIDLDDEGPLALPGDPKFGVSLYKANAWITPTLEFAVETKGFSVKRAAIQARADIEGTLIPEISYRPEGTEKEKEWNVHAPMKKLVLVGFIYGLPVWMDYTYTTKVKLDAEANIGAMLRFGWNRNASLSAGASYVKDATPRTTYTRNATVSPLTVEPVSLSVGGTVQAKVSLVPQLDVRLESLLGFYVNADPRAEFEITADGGIYVSGEGGKLQMTAGGNATLTGGFFADLNAGLSIIGVDQEYLPAMDPYRIYTNGWELEFPEPAALAFTVPAAPQAVSVALGGSLNLEGTASGGDGTIFYQWLHNGILIPGQTSRQLVIPNVTSGNAGSYTLRARAGTETVVSPAFTVTTYNPGTPLGGFAYIPAGWFEMGQDGIATPVHSVYVSGFYMGKYEVTKELWDEVRAWGMQPGRGYTDLAEGNGSYASKGINHPVHSITWYDIVKWCNARSEKENLTPCYTVGGLTYKTGQDPAVVCNFAANGYRLPTEAEWEKGARGGHSSKLFPWGTDIITHYKANYFSDASYAYDMSQTRGYHPDYMAGGFPYTAPVNSFTPNDYGLYNMAGNVWEWCWDWYGSYTADPQTNPQGPISGSERIHRGGCWSIYANNPRCANRHIYLPYDAYFSIGFRVARTAASPPNISAGVVAYYPFDGSANDASANGNHGTPYGNVVFVAGNVGMAAQFDGIDDYITVANHPSLDLSSSFTLSAWIFQEDTNPLGYRIIDKTLAGLSEGWAFDTYGNDSGGHRLRLQGVELNTANVVGTTDYTLSAWHHVVATVSGTTGKVYLDGQEDGIGTVGQIPSNSLDIRIGRATPSNADPGDQEFFKGRIDNIRIYNRTLSLAEIQQIYQLEKGF